MFPTGSLIAVAAITLAALPAAQATTIYSQDFQSLSLVTSYNPYVGGYYTPRLGYGVWAAADNSISVQGGTLRMQANYGNLGAAIVLNPALFTAGQTYTLSYEIEHISGYDANDVATASIWSGRGFSPAGTTGNEGAPGLIISTGTNEMIGTGGATATRLAHAEKTAAGTYQLSFTYTVGRAIALYFGVNTNGSGSNLERTRFDNVVLSSVSAVPEVSAPAAAGLLLALGGLGHRR